jgi:hypothetical protein
MHAAKQFDTKMRHTPRAFNYSKKGMRHATPALTAIILFANLVKQTSLVAKEMDKNGQSPFSAKKKNSISVNQLVSANSQLTDEPEIITVITGCCGYGTLQERSPFSNS